MRFAGVCAIPLRAGFGFSGTQGPLIWMREEGGPFFLSLKKASLTCEKSGVEFAVLSKALMLRKMPYNSADVLTRTRETSDETNIVISAPS